MSCLKNYFLSLFGLIKLAKSNATIEFLFGRKPDDISVLPTWDVPEGRTHAPRLAWQTTRPFKTDMDLIATEFGRTALPDCQYVIDTSFVTGVEWPNGLWDRLLANSILVPPLVQLELEPWLNDPRKNSYFHAEYASAVSGSHKSIKFLPKLNLEDPIDRGACYYIRLLGFRKEVLSFAEGKLSKTNGISPAPEDIDRWAQKLVQSRGFVLAKKGALDAEKPNWLADEATVVRAAISAINSGRETVILTRDNDLLEQFYKLMYMLDTDYRGMLLADAYATQPLNFIQRPVSDSFAGAFHIEDARLLHMPVGGDERVLPSKFCWVMLYVDVFGGEGYEQKLTHLAFCAEKEMIDVVRMKGMAGGKNTNRFGAMNFRRAINPYLTELLGSFCILAKDKSFYDSQGLTWGVTDIEYVIAAKERGRQVVYAEIQ